MAAQRSTKPRKNLTKATATHNAAIARFTFYPPAPAPAKNAKKTSKDTMPATYFKLQQLREAARKHYENTRLGSDENAERLRKLLKNARRNRFNQTRKLAQTPTSNDQTSQTAALVPNPQTTSSNSPRRPPP